MKNATALMIAAALGLASYAVVPASAAEQKIQPTTACHDVIKGKKVQKSDVDCTTTNSIQPADKAVGAGSKAYPPAPMNMGNGLTF